MARQSHKKIGHSLDHPSMAVYRQALEHYSRTGSWPSLGRSGKLPEIVRKEKERIAKTLTETRAKNSILNFFPKSRLGEQVVSSPSTADTNEVTLTTDDSGTSKGTTPQRSRLPDTIARPLSRSMVEKAATRKPLCVGRFTPNPLSCSTRMDTETSGGTEIGENDSSKSQHPTEECHTSHPKTLVGNMVESREGDIPPTEHSPSNRSCHDVGVQTAAPGAGSRQPGDTTFPNPLPTSLSDVGEINVLKWFRRPHWESVVEKQAFPKASEVFSYDLVIWAPRKGLDTGAVEYVRHLLMNNGSITQGAAYLTSALDKAYSVRLRAYEEKSLGGYREIWCSVSPLRDLSMERDHLLRELAAHGAKTSILKWRRRMDLLPGLGLKVPDESLTPRSVEALGPSVVQRATWKRLEKSDPGSATCFLEMLDKLENGEGGEDDVEAIEKDAEDGSSDGSADDADALPMASDVDRCGDCHIEVVPSEVMRDGAIDDPPGIAPARASGDLAKRIRLKAASSTPDNYPVLHEFPKRPPQLYFDIKYMEEYFYIEKEAHKQERRQPRALHPIS
ncbi:hypothetical protein FOZ60_010999, partial [Perkinsus olseni]